MSTRADTVARMLDMLPGVSARKMFGEYALYLDGRVVALVCDDQLFVKPLPAARAILGDVPEGLPYPGAKSHLIADQALDEPEVVLQALQAVAAALPAPKAKKGQPRP